MKERKEISEKFKWNITAIYPKIELFEEDYRSAELKIKEFATRKNDTLNTGENLYNILQMYNDISQILNKLYVYSNLEYDSDTRDNDSQFKRGRVLNLFNKFEEASYFLVPNILKLDYETISQMYNSYSKLREYEINLKNIFRYKSHTLKDSEEKLLSSMSSLLGNNEDVYEMLKESDVIFDSITLSDGSKVEISDSNYSLYLESPDRNVRKSAFETLYKTYKQFSNTYAITLYNTIKENEVIAKIRKYKSSIESTLYHDELSLDIYDNLIQVINSNLDMLHKYYQIKKEKLQVTELHLYDVYAPLIPKFNGVYPFESAFETVTKALKVMGEEYISILTTSFKDRWIDVYPNRGKRSGGYSGGSYDTYPYILLNYQDKYDDMATLAHELGHSMHSYYSRHNNSYQNSNYTLFVAEVASTVNELLLARYMLENSSSKEEKLYILDNIMKFFVATIYRQTMFAEFEKEIYNKVNKDEVLTAEVLSNSYYKLVQKYFGKDVYIDEEIKYEWSRIPHFYYNFYVYKYATGLSAACYIVENVITKGKEEDYINFLKCGSSKNPIDSLKVAGVDLTKKEVIESALAMFNNFLDNFISLSE